MKRKLIAVLFVTTTLLAEEPPMTIDADYVRCREKAIELKGNVVLEHDLGKLSAQSVELKTPDGEKKIRLGTLKMATGVMIHLNEGGHLACDQAEIDFKTLQGIFLGGESLEYSVYSEQIHQKIPLTVQSKKMTAKFTKNQEKEDSKAHVASILAENDVRIEYNRDIIAHSDAGTYERKNNSGNQAFSGFVSLHSSGQQGVCKVVDKHGDEINASTIGIDTTTGHLHFAAPKGSLNPSRIENSPDKVEFEADSLSWSTPEQILILKDNVILHQQGFGTLRNDREIRLTRTSDEGGDRIKMIECEGETDLVMLDTEKKGKHHLTCYGKVTVDHPKLELKMASPRNASGQIMDGQQVYFEDMFGVIYADTVDIKYTCDNRKIFPQEIHLEGNVKMMNTYAEHEPASPLVQYALADKVVYYPETQEAVFSSNGSGRRVLFYDKTNDLQVSAPKLNIKRDKATNKDLIKGSGDVRFSFIENEFEQLKKRFSISIKEKGIHGTK